MSLLENLNNLSDAADRASCAATLQSMADNMSAAIEVWEDIAANTEFDGNRFTVVIQLGAEKTRRLQQIYFSQRDEAARLSQVSGVAFKDALGVSEEVDIVQPFNQLLEDETIEGRSAEAIARQRGRLEAVRAAAAKLGNAA